MDFCAGIGGGRLGLEKAGMKCIAYSEINESASNLYNTFFGNDERNYGNLMYINISDLPYFDVMIAGFPCQTFSIAGKREGFEDERGQVIYGLIEILRKKQVPYFIFENVKGLVNHNKGKTLKIIIDMLSDAGYNVRYNVLNSMDYGVPQMRERVYFIGIRKDIKTKEFCWPEKMDLPDIKNYLVNDDAKKLSLDDKTFLKYLNNKYNNGQYDIQQILKKDYYVLDWRQSDLRIYNDRCPTLRNGRHGILYTKSGELKKLSGMEALMLQGFSMELSLKAKNLKKSDNNLLSLAGNAMTVNVIELLGNKLIECINL